jgi:oxygen-dependent protoporphyrinogen oxidase
VAIRSQAPSGGAGRLDAVVVGAGITGLAAAFHLARAGARVAVVEAADRVGGSIETWREGGWLFELGPNTVLDHHPAVGALVAAAGLDGERLAARPAARRRYVWKGGRLLPLPGGPPGLVATPLFPLGAKLRLLREPWVPPAPHPDAGGREESIADFVRRRLGQDLLDYAVGPFVSGVYAGDPERLSARWAVPKIWALEREHGSLIRGALARRKGPAPGGAMLSFPEGLETLPRRLAAGLGGPGGAPPAVPPANASGGQDDDAAGLHLATPCRRVVRDGAGFRVEAAGLDLAADRVVLAVPADAAAALLAAATGGAARALAAVPYAPVVVVSLGFRRADVAHPLDGFGFLAPRKESLRLLGCLFPSSFFPGRAPAGHVALSAFAGGRTDPGAVDLDDPALLDFVLADLDRALGLRGEPVVVRLRRWPRAIPQYEIGHGRFVELARRIEADLPGLAVAGSFTGGVAVPDCIARGAAAAAQVDRG